MIKILPGVYLRLIFMLGFLATYPCVKGQSSLHDSIGQKILYFSEKDTALQEVVHETLALLKIGTMNDILAGHLLFIDSLAIESQLDKQEILHFTEQVVRALQYLPPQASSSKYASGLDNLAGLYESAGQYKKALPIFQDALSIKKKELGEDHIDYGNTMNNLGFLYREMGLYDKALPLLQQALTITKKVFGEDHPDYAISLNNLGLLYEDIGQYEKALPLFLQSSTIRKKILGEEHPHYIISLNNLAMLYDKMGKYEKALPLYQQALVICENTLDENHLLHSSCLNNTAFLYREMGLYDKALPLFQQALAIVKKKSGEEHPAYAVSLNNLALLYRDTEQYGKALPLFQQALVIRKKILGEQHPAYANSLNNLALLYSDMGLYDKALLLFQDDLVITKKKIGEENSSYATSLNNLAQLYRNMSLYDKALPLYQQMLDIWKKIVGEEHPDYATGTNNLALLYWDMGLDDKALSLFEDALKIRKRVLREEHPDYANSLTNLAATYRRMSQYDKALPLLQQALFIRKKILTEEHPAYANVLNNLGLLYINNGNYANAAASFIRASGITLRYLNHIYSSVSEKEKLALLNRMSLQFSYLPSLSMVRHHADPSETEQMYASELMLKGMVLQDQQTLLHSIHQREDSSVMDLYVRWRTNQSLIGKQLLLPLFKRLPYLDSLQEATNQLEQKLSRSVASFRNTLNSQAITTRDISKKLVKKQAAVEFMRFQLAGKSGWTDSILYAALVLLPGDSACRFVPLCEERQLKKLVGRSSAVRTAGPLNDSLYNLVWRPLEKYLAGTSTVYFAPTGLLHRIAFQSLHADPTHMLIDKYHLNQVLSTRSFSLSDQPSPRPAQTAIWGNIDYGLQTTGLVAARGEQEQNVDTADLSLNFYYRDTRGLHEKGWPSLPGTKHETNNISHLLKQAGITVTKDSGSVATEEAFKALDGKSPQVLHLATHGFFLPVAETKLTDSDLNTGRNALTMQQNPLFRSGLVLAGGNKTWKGEAIAGKEDGILTAYEIAQMDLSNTNLVVLSACETALGDLQGNEGVFGLQRAFKMAGVKQLIMSLWKVPDTETTELMTLFYRNWLGGQTTREALRSAQLKMKEKYPPEKWAAFVLVE